MPFGKKRSDKVAIVYEYGCLPPEGGLPAVAERQLVLADDFWNSLADIDRRHRAKMREILDDGELGKLNAHITSCKARIEELRGQIKGVNQRERRNAGVDANTKAEIARLKAEVKATAARIKEIKPEHIAKQKPLLEENDALRQAAVKRARQWFSDRGLYWGTYNAVLRSYETAHKVLLKSGEQMQAHRYTGEGRWVVQIITTAGEKPTTAEDLATGTMVQIDPVDFSDWKHISRGERRRRARTKCRIRVGSEGRAPVWLELPCVMHRPLPEGAEIVGADVTRRLVGPARWEYRLHLTLRVPAPVPADAAKPAIGVDIGWRALPNGGTRVAYAVGEDGSRKEVVCPDDILAGLAKSSDLRSLRDEKMNRIKAFLRDVIPGLDSADLSEQTEHLAMWKSPKRLIRLYRWWKEHRVEGDTEAFGRLHEWYYHDYWHLYQYEDDMRQQVLARRRDMYRIAAKEIAERASVVVIEEFDLRKFAQEDQPEDGEDNKIQRARRVAVAPSEFRIALRQACAARGVRVVEKPAQNTTRVHVVCGQVVAADYAADVTVRCPRCGVAYDQDANAALNLLGAGRGESTPAAS